MGLFGSWFDDLLGSGGGTTPAAPISVTPTQAPVPAPASPDAMAQLQALMAAKANPSTWQKIAGGLGGALSDFGMIRAGHPEAANKISSYFGGIDQAKTGMLAQNALGQVMGDANGGADGQLPSDLPLKLAKLQALGVDITPIQTMLSVQASMRPQYTYDDAGNTFVTLPGQQRRLLSTGPGKVMSGKEPQVAINPYGGGGPAAPSGPAAAPQAQPGFQSFYQSFLAPHEGGYTPSDGNGAPANFGINQKANPDVNVATLTPDKAQQIMHDRYWVPSGADQLPPALGVIQADTAVNMGVGTAKQLLQQSGGDPQKYLALRAQRYQAIAAQDPSKAASLPVWLKRNQDLGQYAAGLGQQSDASAAAPQGSAHVLYDPGPDWRDATPAEKSQGIFQVNRSTGEKKPIPSSMMEGQMFGASAAGNNPNLHGPAYLQTVDPKIATQVKALAEGRMQFPTGFALRSPYWQSMLQAVSQYDPSFDAVNYNARARTRADFTAGKSAQNITAMNTALQHAGVVSDALAKLNNSEFPTWNQAKNWIAQETGNPGPTNAKEAVDALASEGRKVFAAGGVGNLQELENWQRNFPINGSPEQQQGALKQFAALLRSRLDAVGDQYNRGMGTTADPLSLLSPKARQTIQKLEGGQNAQSGALVAPKVGAVVKGYRFKGGDPANQASWARVP